MEANPAVIGAIRTATMVRRCRPWPQIFTSLFCSGDAGRRRWVGHSALEAWSAVLPFRRVSPDLSSSARWGRGRLELRDGGRGRSVGAIEPWISTPL